MAYFRSCVVLLLLLILSGCANVTVRRVTSDNQSGLRYWRPDNYFLLSENFKDGITSCEISIVTLPNRTEEYAVTFTPGFGSVKATPTLHDGWRLDSLQADADSKTSENLTAIASLIKSAYPNGLAGATADSKTARPAIAGCKGLYRLQYNQAGFIDHVIPVRWDKLI
ncbi:hypothetical protein [Rhizobium sp. BK418]|uniref:hypothetical protein n=1 Tax=Rhizobium sp. BK418 TaxID=2512120 RepID=UPI001048EF25|nr:hypothetical protein [Rhizobium sp. BK418]